MRFGPIPLARSEGAVAAHAIRSNGYVLKKGARVTAADISELRARGVTEIVGAELGPDDVTEDEAAYRIAMALAGDAVRVEAPFTGRANIFAKKAGLLIVDRARIDALNEIDEAVTFATLNEHAVVAEGAMVATVKIIPFALPEALVARCEEAARGPLARVAPFALRRVAAVSTLLPGLDPKVVDKTIAVLERRLTIAGAKVFAERRVAHDEAALTRALNELAIEKPDLIVVFGASAITDRRDVVPAAIEAAGGAIERLGMPVDPGNLLLLGEIDGRPVLGAPGCARSPKENGFDWVLNRLLAKLPIGARDITAMGVGGLLMEIVSRPQPRADKPAEPAKPKVSAIILAAGRSTRMGGPNKLLETINGRPLVRLAVEAALAGGLKDVVVVTGHQRLAVQAALSGLNVRFVDNPRFAEGLSTSLKAGLAALPSKTDGALVLLGDMPRVGARLVARLAEAFDPASGAHLVAPTRGGRRGNPVLWGRRFFEALAQVEGDVGGRHLIEENLEALREVAADDDGSLIDVDTPEALAALREQG
ncbi:NTP transferase domain-containing protein [Hansschlegelia quercus]|uniref:4-diphosphocytidyl-2C-methyl-D-erythritol kinase n=1 Tax=Hansschlegelia quercus TaxID=2528245 RepID=A0A4Q9GKP0_9HYPH|nr:molybdopterin-binding/glycosyltransferase family 2 protein [Hansschlegelia quercus]TBN54863.1 4-diphosphocytidyl-2C-methyl-D-erythritol kinase [Hansschlegelia quercus]